ncbi:MAG: hypothetical protein BroJett012_31930 [Betaproteobacteria bacterium]|nr:MAG: hypothetical protein BroJett012_31930 [Betaproteobacteria bacterium]
MIDNPAQPPTIDDSDLAGASSATGASDVAGGSSSTGVGGVTDVAQFWSLGAALPETPPHDPSGQPEPSMLEQLGASPFERGGFPLIGFLATVYEKCAHEAQRRLDPQPQHPARSSTS